MKKIIFKVSSQKEYSVASLLKEVNQISCRIRLDFKNSLVEVENVKDDMIDNVVDLVNNYYTIEEVCIDNTTGEQKAQQVILDVAECSEEQDKAEKEQSRIDETFENVECQNDNINNAINKLLKNVKWFMGMKKATERDVINHIYTCMNEMSMRFAPKRFVQFSVGDIVECSYGSHLSGEVNGNHVHSIVCNIENEFMAYVVPIVQNTEGEITARSYLECTIPNDLLYYEGSYKDGVAILDKGKPVRVERFGAVIGKTSPAFFKKLLLQLKSGTFDFTHNLEEEHQEIVENVEEYVEQTAEIENSDPHEEETVEIKQEKLTKRAKTPKEKPTEANLKKEEAAVLDVIETALAKLDKSRPVAEQVEDFMQDIGMLTSEKLVVQAFSIACDIKKINYGNVASELHKLNPNVREEIIVASLKETFKKWLEQYPDLAAKCPKISLMAVLKVFAKRFV